MSAVHNQNVEYLNKLVAGLDRLPLAVAKRAGFLTLLEMVSEHTAVDSGQAAANWVLAGYTGGPSYGSQKMMWGYDNVAPTDPVGFKHSYGGYIPWGTKGWAYNLPEGTTSTPIEGPRGESGDIQKILSWQMEQGAIAIASIGNDASGITVYNPITPGFQGFAPGDDSKYEEYALGEASSRLAAVTLSCIARAEVEVMAEYKAGRLNSANV